MTDELKPCEHCSSAEVEGMETGRVGDRKYFVGCWRCHAQSGLYATPREAITAWNRRDYSHLADNLPDAMVEAGARAFWNDEQPDDEPQWDDVEMEHPVEIKSEIRSGIKAALTAALNVKEG